MSIRKYKSYNINIILKYMLYKQNYYLRFYTKTRSIYGKIKWFKRIKEKINDFNLNNIRMIVVRIQQYIRLDFVKVVLTTLDFINQSTRNKRSGLFDSFRARF